MKKTVVTVISVMVGFMLLAILPVRGEEQVYEQVVRLHILAASDSSEDQGEKIAVRDAILAEWGEQIAALSDSEEAEKFLQENLSLLEQTAALALSSQKEIKISLEEAYFDRRSYGEVVLPAGKYPSLIVKISEGEGQNWWCVLYPPLCTEAALGEYQEADAFESETVRETVTGEYTVKIRLLEWLDHLFTE